jgi:hypothetical protein
MCRAIPPGPPMWTRFVTQHPRRSASRNTTSVQGEAAQAALASTSSELRSGRLRRGRSSLRKGPGLKVLFTTGYARDAILHQGRLDHEAGVITKPFTYADLAARVRDALDRGL